jgi:hypothetical protein
MSGFTGFSKVEEKIPEAFYSEALVDFAFSHYKSMLPLHRWLMNVFDVT